MNPLARLFVSQKAQHLPRTFAKLSKIDIRVVQRVNRRKVRNER